MKSTVNTTTTLTRHSETGDTVTNISFVEGMPPMIRIEQKNPSGQRQAVEITFSELSFFTYALSEIRNFRRMVNEIDENDDDEDGGPRITSLLRGR